MLKTLLFVVLVCICLADFNFAVVSDVHIDSADGKYPNSIRDARIIVEQLNKLVETEKIRFVIISGDCTDRATMFREFKDIFSQLKVPFLPLPGNHDIMRNNKTWQEPKPTGDILFGEVFRDNFEKFPGLVWNHKPTFNPDISANSHFQNFVLKIENFVILGLDFNSRLSGRPAFNGVVPNGNLHDFEGGTYRWIENTLKSMNPSQIQQILIVQHHPFRIPMSRVPALFGFVQPQKDRLLSMYEKHMPKEKFWGMLSGHIHRHFNGLAVDGWGGNFKQWETNANGVKPVYSLVRVKGSKVDGVTHHYL